MKFTPLIYILIFSMLLPPPHVFAAAPVKTYVQRLNDVIKESGERQRDLALLLSKGEYCGPTSWKTVCRGKTPGAEMSALNDNFKKTSESLTKAMPDAQKLDSKIDPSKVASTTACKGGTAALAEYESESKKAAERIRPILAAAVDFVKAARSKYNKVSNDFIPMVRQCGGSSLSSVSDDKLPQFAGEGLVMLYKPILFGGECNGHAAKAAQVFVDANMRRSNGGVQEIYSAAGQAPSGLQEFEAIASLTLKELDSKITDLDKAIKQNQAKDSTDCGPAAKVAKQEEGGKADPQRKSDVTGTDKKPDPAAKVTGSKSESEADAAAKAADAKGKLDPKSNDPVVKNNPVQGNGAAAAESILGGSDGEKPKPTAKAEAPGSTFDSEFEAATKSKAPTTAKADAPKAPANKDLTVTKDEVVDVSMPEDTAPKVRTSRKDMQDEIAVGRANFEKEKAAREAEAAPLDLSPPAPPEKGPAVASTRPEPEPKPETKPERQPPEAGPVAQKEPPAKEQTTVQTQEQTGAQPPPANPPWGVAQPVADSASSSSSMLGIGLLGLAAAGGAAAYFITKKNRKTSSLPPLPPAPAPTATATATDTATATATSTATATGTGTSTGTATSTSTGTETITLTQTTSSSDTVTATSSNTNTATRESANVTGSSLFRPSATP